jgi:hypothetical protein
MRRIIAGVAAASRGSHTISTLLRAGASFSCGPLRLGYREKTKSVPPSGVAARIFFPTVPMNAGGS